MKFIKKCSMIGLEIGLAIPFVVRFYKFFEKMIIGPVVENRFLVEMPGFLAKYFSWLY